ncbi:MAG: glycosyltransferase family 39 protein [Synechococcus sp.]|nr:glycosyltransferase family 39 protein [Synechococcus sp.]
MTRKAAFLLIGFTALRLLLALIWPAGIDEAYAISISHDWSLSYFDHPPVVFTIAGLTHLLTGSNSASILRIPYVLLGTASGWLIYDITRQAYNRSAAFWALAWYSIAPFFLISAGLFVVPDGPLNFGLLATLWILLPGILNPNHRLKPFHYGAAGIFLALSLASKYQAVAFLASICIFTLYNKKNREWLRSPAIIITILVGLAGLLPVLIWNGSHDWISFGFQSSRAGNAGLRLFPLNFLSTLVGQMAYLLPGTWIVVMACSLKGISKTRSSADSLFSWLTLVLPVAFLLIALVSERSLPHWSMSGFLFGFPLAGQWTSKQARNRLIIIKKAWATTTMLLSIAAIGVGLQFKEAIFTRALAKEPLSIDRNWQLQDWSSLHQLWSDFGMPGNIVTRSWTVGAKAGYTLGPDARILPLRDPRHFQFMADPKQAATKYGTSIKSAYLAIEPLDPRINESEAIKAFSDLLASNGWQPQGRPEIIEQKSGDYSRFKLLGIRVRKSAV